MQLIEEMDVNRWPTTIMWLQLNNIRSIARYSYEGVQPDFRSYWQQINDIHLNALEIERETKDYKTFVAKGKFKRAAPMRRKIYLENLSQAHAISRFLNKRTERLEAKQEDKGVLSTSDTCRGISMPSLRRVRQYQG